MNIHNYSPFRHKRSVLLAALLGTLLPAAQAQYAKDYKRTADQFYTRGDYYSAAKYYEKYLQGSASANAHYNAYEVKKQGPVTNGADSAGSKAHIDKTGQRPELEYRLAESYRQLHDYTHASPWYKAVAEDAPAAYPLVHYWYAICLRVDGKYGWAQKELEGFLKNYTASDNYRTQATRELENIVFIQQELSNPKEDVLATKLDASINKEGASYAANWLNPTTLVFTSTRSDIHSGKQAEKNNPVYTNTLYYATLQGGSSTAQGTQSSQSGPTQVSRNSTGEAYSWSETGKLAIPSIPDRQQGAATFTPDGQQAFFTAWSEDKDGQRHALIYTSTKNGSGWTSPVALAANINAEGADSRQPQVSPDGEYLLFSSDRPGGRGGFDIWMVPLKAGQPGKAVNAGPAINGKGDEQAPFYHAASHTLVFSSNGRTGMGGFDLYAAKGSFPASWTEPQDMGFPVNSVKDDLYFIARGNRLLEDALLSSDRSSACCLELFAIHKKYTEYFIGQILDSTTHAPLAGVEITGKDNAGHPLAPQTTGPDGKYIVATPAGLSLQFTAARDKYLPASWTANPGATDSIYNPATYLASIPEKKADLFEGQKKLVTHNINFEFRKRELTPGSYAYMEEVAAYLKANPTVKLEIAAHTDGIGQKGFNLQLSQARAKACVDYLVKAGIDRHRLIARGFGESLPLEKETTPDGKDNPSARENNRRVEMTLK